MCIPTEKQVDMRSSVSIMRKARIQPAAPIVRKFSRFHRRNHRRCLRQEYKKLRSLLPGSSKNTTQLRKKVGVVDAAFKYICDLHVALLVKFSVGGIPPSLAGVLDSDQVTSASDIKALAAHLIQTGQVGQTHNSEHQQQAALLKLTTVSTSLSSNYEKNTY